MKTSFTRVAALSLLLCALPLLTLAFTSHQNAGASTPAQQSNTSSAVISPSKARMPSSTPRPPPTPRSPKRSTSATPGASPTAPAPAHSPPHRLRHAAPCTSPTAPSPAPNPSSGSMPASTPKRLPPRTCRPLHQLLLDNYDTNADAHWLVDYHDIWVMPVAQPRRPPYRRSGRQQPRPPAQERQQPTAAPLTPNRRTQFGTDLNRNFPFQWACCNGRVQRPVQPTLSRPLGRLRARNPGHHRQTARPHPRPARPERHRSGPTHRDGRSPEHALHRPDQLLLLELFHRQLSPNGLDLDTIVAHMSARDAGGNGYRYCQSGAPGCLGGADGTTMDWAYGDWARLPSPPRSRATHSPLPTPKWTPSGTTTARPSSTWRNSPAPPISRHAAPTSPTSPSSLS